LCHPKLVPRPFEPAGNDLRVRGIVEVAGHARPAVQLVQSQRQPLEVLEDTGFVVPDPHCPRVGGRERPPALAVTAERRSEQVPVEVTSRDQSPDPLPVVGEAPGRSIGDIGGVRAALQRDVDIEAVDDQPLGVPLSIGRVDLRGTI
jgi:hypothetical protein